MSCQEDLYESYRKKLISDSQLQAKIKEAYSDTADEVNAYVGKGTILGTCISAFTAGFLLACYYMVSSLSGLYKMLFVCLTFGGFLACIIIGGMLYSKFKKALTRNIYFSFVEDTVIRRYIRNDQMEQYADQLMNDYYFSKYLYEQVT